jgi:hypothetical protein
MRPGPWKTRSFDRVQGGNGGQGGSMSKDGRRSGGGRRNGSRNGGYMTTRDDSWRRRYIACTNGSSSIKIYRP